MSALADTDMLYLRKKAFKVAILLMIAGSLNWLFIGLFRFNLVETLLGSFLSRFVYVAVGLSAVAIMFDRDTYLPFLGETVLPCSLLPDRVPPGATKEVHVSAAPGSKILYWAAEPATESLKQINDWKIAYAKFENAGVTRADDNGNAILKVRNPQAYVVPWKGRLEPHIHFRICGDNGMMSRIKTLYVKDEHVEGFSS